MDAGTIILLNGTVSTGKSSLARALQHVLPEPYLHLGADLLGAMCPPAWAGGDRASEGFAWVPVAGATPPMTAMVVGPYGHFLVQGMHQAVAALSRMGHGVIVDHIFMERRWLLDCLAAWNDLPVVLVGVRCPLAIAEQRERERGDRVTGVARWQFDRVHDGMSYDIEIDTSTYRPGAGARTIAAWLRDGPLPAAFRGLAERFGVVG
jgi:chloramphenicol 3-O phosphotransferase